MTALEEIKKALEAAEQFIVNGVELGYIRMPNPETPDSAHDTLPMIRQAQTALERLQSEIEHLSADVKREAELATHMANDCNDAQARAEAAEAEVKRLKAELALSKPLYSRRQIEARVKLLEEALIPFGHIGDDGRGSALPNDAPLAVVNANMPDLPQWLAKVRGVITQGDVRRARTALASTGGEHNAE